MGFQTEDLESTIEKLEAELSQQRFNNKHNLSIDQIIADKITELEKENERLRAMVFHFTGKMD
mgnify:CR=1 FL=1